MATNGGVLSLLFTADPPGSVTNAIELAGPALILNELLVSGVSPEADAVKVYSDEDLSM